MARYGAGRICNFTKLALTLHSIMSAPCKIAFVSLTLLWLGLAFRLLDLGGVSLYNILVALLAGGFILVPLWKRWGGSNNS